MGLGGTVCCYRLLGRPPRGPPVIAGRSLKLGTRSVFQLSSRASGIEEGWIEGATKARPASAHFLPRAFSHEPFLSLVPPRPPIHSKRLGRCPRRPRCAPRAGEREGGRQPFPAISLPSTRPLRVAWGSESPEDLQAESRGRVGRVGRQLQWQRAAVSGSPSGGDVRTPPGFASSILPLVSFTDTDPQLNQCHIQSSPCQLQVQQRQFPSHGARLRHLPPRGPAAAGRRRGRRTQAAPILQSVGGSHRGRHVPAAGCGQRRVPGLLPVLCLAQDAELRLSCPGRSRGGSLWEGPVKFTAEGGEGTARCGWDTWRAYLRRAGRAAASGSCLCAELPRPQTHWPADPPTFASTAPLSPWQAIAYAVARAAAFTAGSVEGGPGCKGQAQAEASAKAQSYAQVITRRRKCGLLQRQGRGQRAPRDAGESWERTRQLQRTNGLCCTAFSPHSHHPAPLGPRPAQPWPQAFATALADAGCGGNAASVSSSAFQEAVATVSSGQEGVAKDGQ